MKTLILLALAGLGAQLVDGSLGMAYGVTSTTLLLAFGTNPAAASATVHLAEIGTTLASGVAHWRFGNVDWRVVVRIGVPGAVGAFAGATFLSSLSTDVAKPVMALILLGLGVYVLGRFTFLGLPSGNLGKPLRKRFLSPLGVVAGFLDATGGGGWGPVGTPAILASGRLEPRKVIGSIDTSEFLVAVAASLGFLLGLGSEGVDYTWAAALLLGGLVAAPLAAWLVRHVPPRILGSAVGGLIVLTNIRTLLRSDWVGAGDAAQWTVYGIVYAVWAAALAHSFREHRRNVAAASAAHPTPEGGAGSAPAPAGAPVPVPAGETRADAGSGSPEDRAPDATTTV
ncbi:sulfite exporter TauE/SafE family protein [Streptomyces roseolilacinus]|uniref:sulfite exporter TauE/SafE family protein n=1 Tax=Streptomyces roseolilacinus TaxID=66904 RepID=UPI00381E4ADD